MKIDMADRIGKGWDEYKGILVNVRTFCEDTVKALVSDWKDNMDCDEMKLR